MTIKKGDTVRVISGRDKGKQGIVEKAIPALSKVVVAGVNIRKRHYKPSQARSKGGIVEYAAPLTSSNVMLLCPHCSKTTRVKSMLGDNDKKYRYCQHCQGSLDNK